MKSKFSEFAKDYGLIVVGYAGSDRSIMESVSALIKNDDYFKGGIYWCLRRDDDVSEELRKLLWKEKAYFVQIDGFDELFAELYANFNQGAVLPISTISLTRRPAEIVGRLIDNQATQKTNSPILAKAREQLTRQSKRATLMSLIVRPDADEPTRIGNEKMSDDELITQLELQNAIALGNYQDAINRGRAALKTEIGPAAKREILNLIIRAHRFLDQLAEAI